MRSMRSSASLGAGSAAAAPRRTPSSAALDDGRLTTTIAFNRRTDPSGPPAALVTEAPPAEDDPRVPPAVRVVRVEKHTPGRSAAAEWRDAGDREALLRNAATDPDGVVTLAGGGPRSPLRLAVWSRNAAAGGAADDGGEDAWPGLTEPAGLSALEALALGDAGPVDGRSSSPDSQAAATGGASGGVAPLRRVTPLDGLGRPSKSSYTYAQSWKRHPAHRQPQLPPQKQQQQPDGRAPAQRQSAGGAGAAATRQRGPRRSTAPDAVRRSGSAPAAGRRRADAGAASSPAPPADSSPQQQQQPQPPASKGGQQPLDSTFGQSAADPSCLTQLLMRGPFAGARPHALSVLTGGRAVQNVMATRRAAEADDAHPLAAMALYDPATRTRQLVEATPGVVVAATTGGAGPSQPPPPAISLPPDGRILSGQPSPLRKAHAAAAVRALAPLSRDDVITVLSPLGADGAVPEEGAAAYVPDVYIVRQQKHAGGPAPPPPPPPVELQQLLQQTQARPQGSPAPSGTASSSPLSPPPSSSSSSPLALSLAALTRKRRAASQPRVGAGHGAGATMASSSVAALAVSGVLGGLLLGRSASASPAVGEEGPGGGGGDAGATQVLSAVPGGVRAASHLPSPLQKVLAAAAATEAVSFANERRIGSVVLRDARHA